jgi:hypothetical protein
MIRVLATALALSAIAAPAFALSCLRPDAVRMFEYARDSKETFYVIKGRITPVGDYAIPEAKQTTSPTDKDAFADTPVQITGVGLSANGFSVPVEIGATVRLTCLSVWCPGPPPDGELLMIVKKDGIELTLDIGPCGGTAVSWDPASEERLLRCHLSDTCVAEEF